MLRTSTSATASHTANTIGPDQIRKAAGTPRGSHGRSVSHRSESGLRAAPTQSNRPTPAAATKMTRNVIGDTGRSPNRSPPVEAKLTEPSDSQAAKPAAGASTNAVVRWLRMTAFYMDAEPDSIRRDRRSVALACVAGLAVTTILTWPLVLGFDRFGRTAPGDGPYSIWNVAWVAHALTSDPLHLLDANIFHPHSKALTYSEINLVPGLVAVPGWLATHNPYVAHNIALFFGFTTSAISAWLLARKLTGHGGAAFVGAVLYAFCPYFFAHTPHIQLLMGGGIPIALLLMYRVAAVPGASRGFASLPTGFPLA
jgi:hypothetical protein